MTSDDATRSESGTRQYAQQIVGPTYYCNHCQRPGRSVVGRRSRFLRLWGVKQPACTDCLVRIDKGRT